MNTYWTVIGISLMASGLSAVSRATGQSTRTTLADKMKLSPEQIQKACEIRECSPK
jgi:hypothetical protein